MKNLKDLFEHEIKDLYSAEQQYLEAIPKLLDKVSDEKLRTALENHKKETQNHIKRLEEVCEELNIRPSGEKCKAMEGLVREVESFLKEDTEKDVRDAGIIAEAQRVEHYEISGYGTAVRFAKELGHEEIASKLKKTLEEEYGLDDRLTDMAEDRLNKRARS